MIIENTATSCVALNRTRDVNLERQAFPSSRAQVPERRHTVTLTQIRSALLANGKRFWRVPMGHPRLEIAAFDQPFCLHGDHQ